MGNQNDKMLENVPFLTEYGKKLGEKKYMVNTNEIRIGNKFFFYKPEINDPQILTVKGIMTEEDNITYVYSLEYAPINLPNGVFGISLSPEILEMCRMDEINIVYVDDSPFDGSIGDYKILEYKSRMKNGFYLSHSTHLQYLHQLQNLYFALTGEELVFDFPTK